MLINQAAMIMSGDNPKEKLPNPVAILFRSVLGWAVAGLLGIASVFSVRLFGFSNMLAAQTTIGIIGLTGGLSHSFLIRAAGGKVSWRQCLFLAIVWALSCIGGVTPLFFTLGTPLKMAVLAFYSFAIFGALGGGVTAFMMRSLFDNASSNDVIPCTLTWSFSIGLAAIVSDALGEWLQTCLPMLIAGAFAFGTMTLIIGCGGGYSVILFLRAARDRRQTLEGFSIEDKVSPPQKK